MPLGLTQDLAPDLDAQDAAAAALPTPQSLRYGVEFTPGAFSNKVIYAGRHLIQNTLGLDPEDPSKPDQDSRLPSDVLNTRYGVDGYLRFNQPATAEDAAWLSAQAHEKRWRDIVLSKTRPNPLLDLGASVGGSLLDPIGLGVMAASGPFGELAAGAEAAGETGAAVNGLGRLANLASSAPRVALQGALLNAPYVAADATVSRFAGDDYEMGDALRDIATGAIFHTGLHFAGAALGGLRPSDPTRPAPGDRFANPEPVGPPPAQAWVAPDGAPDAVRDLSPLARRGAFVKALDDLADDRAVDVGQYVDRAINPEGMARLGEVSAEPAVPSFRPLDDAGFGDAAITPRGAEVPVRYGLVELNDLVTSHSNDLQSNPAFPPELQPRDRARAGAQARNYQLEQDMNPRLLMGDVSAASGAPVISPDGVVESGNGRAIALRRSADTGSAAWPKYLAELKAQGLDTEGLQRPVLVRMRTEPMDGPARAALARDMNGDVTERMSAPEQAMADAARLPDSAFDQIPEGRGPASSADFARAFLAHVAPGQENALTSADGRLSPEGARRIKAAVLARAYGDPGLVGQVFDDEAAPSRQLAEGLAEAAPAWARMRAAAARGEIPPALDITLAVRAAMDLVRHAAQEKIGLGELLAERLGQKEIFGGEAVSPATEAILRLAYRDEAFKRATPPDRFAAALKDYARQALAVTPGEDLFGETAGENTSRQILDQLAQRFARGDTGAIDLRAPGRAAAPRAAEPPVIDLRQPGGDGNGGDGGVPRPDGAGAEGAGPGAGGNRPEFRTDELDGKPVFYIEPKGLSPLKNFIFGWVEGDRLRIERSEVEPGMRGQGLGLALYMRAAEEAQAIGKSLASDHEVSKDAARVWDALKRRGFDVLRSPRAIDGGGKIATADRTPVFEIKAPKVKPRTKAARLTGAQIVAADPELKALAEDTAAFAEAHGVDLPADPKTDPDTLAEAIRAAAFCLAEEGKVS